MAALDRMLAEVRSGSDGRLLLVGGEAGVGKTALLRRFCERPDARVLWGACEPLWTPRPLGPLVDVSEQTGGELEQLVAAAARPHDVAAALLRELRAGTPAVVVLEDVHWADEATLDVVAHLAGRIASARALVLVSFRDDELDRAEHLRLLLGELRPERLKLAPLSPAGVAQLAEPHSVDGDELYRRTGGNPFFVVEVLAAPGQAIPDTVREAVLARAGRLSEPARRLLEAAAIVPGPVDSWLLEELGGELVEHVDECLASGMLVAGPANFAFRHELARAAVEGATPPNRRLALHRAALVAHGSRPADVARLAHHADAAGDADAVLHWAPLAAERAAASGAHREAAALFERALAHARGLPLRTRAKLLQRLADECYTTARFEAAIAAQREALACHRRLDDARGVGDAMRSLSRLLFFAGGVEEAEPIALEAVERLEQLPAGHELAMAYGNLSQRRMVIEDATGVALWGNRALELANRLDDTEAQVYALSNLGAAELRIGARSGLAKLERALVLAGRHGLEEYAGRAFHLLVLCALRSRDFGLAGPRLEAGLEYCRERGLDTWRLYLLATGALVALHRGLWLQAGDLAAAVLRDPRSAPVARGWALVAIGLARARRGDPDASEPLELADRLARPTGELMQMAPAAAARAEAAWLAGEPEAMAGVTDTAFALARSVRAPWVVGELAYWRHQAGLRDELGAGALAEPYRLALAGDWAHAAEAWRRLGCPYEAALALAESDDDGAVGRAISELRELGARPALKIVSRKLRQRGVRGIPRGPRPRTRENPAGLTARELEVLALLAEGLPNAQIARRLVLSERTVEHHVSAVFRKLDVHTRGAAGAKARQLALLPADGGS